MKRNEKENVLFFNYSPESLTNIFFVGASLKEGFGFS